jgi:hypothetical protein
MSIYARDLEQRGGCGALFASSVVCIHLELPKTMATGLWAVERPDF